MKINKLSCPNCGGMLNMDINECEYIYCPYCGQKFYVDKEKNEFTYNKNININKNVNYTNRYIDDADVIRAKSEAKEKRNVWFFIIALWIAIFVVVGGINLYFVISEKVAESQGKVSAGFYRDYIGENYKTVVKQLKALGFEDIETIDLDDAGLFNKKNTIESISIDGNSTFESTDYFETDAKVIISYH